MLGYWLIIAGLIAIGPIGWAILVLWAIWELS